MLDNLIKRVARWAERHRFFLTVLAGFILWTAMTAAFTYMVVSNGR